MPDITTMSPHATPRAHATWRDAVRHHRLSAELDTLDWAANSRRSTTRHLCRKVRSLWNQPR